MAHHANDNIRINDYLLGYHVVTVTAAIVLSQISNDFAYFSVKLHVYVLLFAVHDSMLVKFKTISKC